MAQIWFTSDLHFGHKRICELANRPYASVEEMWLSMRDEWNARVAKGDTVYHLGDFSFLNAAATAELIRQLRGNIHFIRGNHDEALAKAFRSDCIDKRRHHLRDYQEIRLDGQKVVLFHFPIAVWDGAHNGAWHLHGHSHGNYDPQDQPLMDVGYDATGQVVISWDEVKAILSTRTYRPVDHHGLD